MQKKVPGPILTRSVPTLARPFSTSPDSEWTPEPTRASSFDELLTASSASLEANGFALVLTPIGPASDRANEEVRRVRSLLGSPRVIGTSLALPPLGVAVVGALALDVLSPRAPSTTALSTPALSTPALLSPALSTPARSTRTSARLSPGQAVFAVRKLAAVTGWFAWVRDPQRIATACNLGAAPGRISVLGQRRGYLVACPNGIATPAADVISPWPAVGSPDRIFRNSPLVVSLAPILPDTVTDTLELIEGSTLTAAQPLHADEADFWGSENVACGVWIPEAQAIMTPAPTTPRCSWCDEVSWHAICPFCHYCAAAAEAAR